MGDAGDAGADWRLSDRSGERRRGLGRSRAGASGGLASLGSRGHALVGGRRLLAFCGRDVGAALYYPLATAAAGLATARVVTRHAHVASWHELGWLGDLRFESMSRLLSIQACVLTGLAVIFTKGSVEASTALTLILASLTLGPVALATGWQASALAGSLAWSAAWGVAGMVIAQRLGLRAGELRATVASVGVLSAAFSLLALAGWLRRERSGLKSPGASGAVAALESPIPLAWSMEIVAFASSLFVVFVVLAAGTNAAALGTWGTTVGVGVILGAALLCVLLVPRWHGEWLVYLAQAVALSGLRRLPAGLSAIDRL